MKTSDRLLVGLATVDITPPVGVTLVGYKPRESTAIGHALRAEALACRTGDTGWILITSDTIGFPREFVAAVREKITATVGVPPEAIMVSGTHTHSGPATIMFGNGKLSSLDRECLATLQERLARVAAEAWTNASPGRFTVSTTGAPDLMSNRRVEAEDGTWTNEWTDPDGKHPGYTDPHVLLVGIERADGTAAGLLVNYGCHPVVLGPGSLDISADYPGYMKDALEEGGVAERVLFTIAGGANINPRVCVDVGAELPQRMGEALAAIVKQSTGDMTPIEQGDPCWRREPWNIVRTRELEKRKERPDSRTGAKIATEIQVLRCGDLAIVGLPGELFSEFNRMLRERSPVPHTIVVSLANDYVGYLPTDQAQREGAYETKMAPADPLEQALLSTAEEAFAAVG